MKIRFRRGSAASWAAANPVLEQGEPGLEVDTGVFKIGDGSTPWASLPGAATAGAITPAEHDLAAWTYDPIDINAGKAGVAGTLYLAALYPQGGPVSQIRWGINTAGITPTAGQNEVGLYRADGTRLAATNVDAQVTVVGLAATNITPQVLNPGLHWVAFLFNAATMPQVYRANDLNATLINANIPIAERYRFATNGAGLSALPASINPVNNVVAQFSYWAGLA